MKFHFFAILLIAIPSLGHGQKTSTKYYNDLSDVISPEVPKEQAKYSKTVIYNEDGTNTFEEFDLKNNVLLSRKTYLKREPYGVWVLKKYPRTIELDYNFKLSYISKKEQICSDTVLRQQIGNYLKDNKKMGYKAPKLENGNSIGEEIMETFVYPEKLSAFGISGKTYVQFEINESGEVQHVMIRKRNMIRLDKEAVRVLRNMKFSSPPMLNGEPITICLTVPIGY
jgi:TonB family protein